MQTLELIFIYSIFSYFKLINSSIITLLCPQIKSYTIRICMIIVKIFYYIITFFLQLLSYLIDSSRVNPLSNFINSNFHN